MSFRVPILYIVDLTPCRPLGDYRTRLLEDTATSPATRIRRPPPRSVPRGRIESGPQEDPWPCPPAEASVPTIGRC